MIASNAALSINAEQLSKIPLVQSGEGSQPYQEVFEQLTRIKQANLSLKYAYILTTTEKTGILQFVVDADPLPKIITAQCLTSLPGDLYDAREIPELINAYSGPSADKSIKKDPWGIFVSGYAPIRDSGGNPMAIIGVDAEATFLQLMQDNIKVAARIALITGILFIFSLVITIIPAIFE